MRRIVIVGCPPVQILDVTGPLEVFSNAPGYEVQLGSLANEHSLQTSRSISLSGALPISTLDGAIDTLIIAGGPGSEAGVYDDAFVSWVAEAATRSRRVASICTGAFLLGAAGLLDGKQAVTHWRFCDQLAREFPKAEVRPEPIFLKSGSVYTSAGITAGIDLCLALVEEDHGHHIALDVARFMVMFLVRPGGQAQYSHMLLRQSISSKPLHELQVWMLENLREDLTVEKLADRLGMSARQFTRVCLRETRMNPGQFVDRMRVEAAQQAIDSSAMGMKEIADTSGFQSADSMRRTFLRVLGVSAAAYASRFKRSPTSSDE
ncbi:GlxA family transcriptional regulator [Granulicella arctica]|uniref:GlxA family transcriptional regulator n=1 Tax=Granulicella arctica TaxID=940613 RepID=UPI0021E081F6|nr:DJ-1/PfpI family protein [Granulicella arctica]